MPDAFINLLVDGCTASLRRIRAVHDDRDQVAAVYARSLLAVHPSAALAALAAESMLRLTEQQDAAHDVVDGVR